MFCNARNDPGDEIPTRADAPAEQRPVRAILVLGATKCIVDAERADQRFSAELAACERSGYGCNSSIDAHVAIKAALLAEAESDVLAFMEFPKGAAYGPVVLGGRNRGELNKLGDVPLRRCGTLCVMMRQETRSLGWWATR
jgi:hypothetical protein